MPADGAELEGVPLVDAGGRPALTALGKHDDPAGARVSENQQVTAHGSGFRHEQR
jgi:hypothetical protein